MLARPVKHRSKPFVVCPAGERLADWIRSHGGYVHHALALSEQTQCGSRCCNVTATAGACIPGRMILSLNRLRFFTPCGISASRGIITREDITGDDAALPLVVVPEQLYLTVAAADAALSPKLVDAGRPRLRETINPGLCVAALLAHQR